MKISVSELASLIAMAVAGRFQQDNDCNEPDTFLAEDEPALSEEYCGESMPEGEPLRPRSEDDYIISIARIPGYLAYRQRCWDSDHAAMSPEEFIMCELRKSWGEHAQLTKTIEELRAELREIQGRYNSLQSETDRDIGFGETFAPVPKATQKTHRSRGMNYPITHDSDVVSTLNVSNDFGENSTR